jgi:DNA-binding CsgD family transcriptional regulator
MDIWHLDHHDAQAPLSVVAVLVSEVGRPGLAATMLEHLGPLLDAGSMAVYQVWSDRPPVMHLSAARGIPDTTRECFALYRTLRLYARDGSFAAVGTRSAGGHACMLRMKAGQAPNADHREAIYVRHHMVERLSLARREADGSVLAVNLYKHDHQHPFNEAQVRHCGELGGTLLALAARHVELHGERLNDRRLAVQRRCPLLTERELDVLERLLGGMTYDGIAADMGVGVSTVKTYRVRAFQRLGIHTRHQLAAELAEPPR